MKTITVIIPDTNSLLIGRILDALEHQTVPADQFEILVVGEDEPGLVRENSQVRFIPTEAGGYASDKRNLGMQEGCGEIYLFMDDDCIPARDLLERHLRWHDRDQRIVGGAVTFGACNYLQLSDNVSAFHDILPCTPAGLRPYLCTANLSVARSVVAHAGKMLGHRNRAEDLEWTVRFRTLGYRLYFDPEAVVFHNPRRGTLQELWQHWYGDAHDTLKVRLDYAAWLHTPSLARHRVLYLWGAPIIAAWATVYTFAKRQLFRQYWHTLPMVYWTKLVWCRGAYKTFPRKVVTT